MKVKNSARAWFLCCLTLVVLTSNSLAGSFADYFVEKTDHNISYNKYTCAAFGDYNNDGFLDLALSIWDTTVSPVGKRLEIWKNDPKNPGTFSNVFTFTGPTRQVAWGDFDNDGDLDLFAEGGSSGLKSWLFGNSGEAGGYTISVMRRCQYCAGLCK